MKKISILLLLFVAVLFTACEKDKENVVIKDTITANTLNALTGSPFVLLMDNAALNFQTFSWTPVDYGFDAAILYTVQADVDGNDFASAIDVVSSDTTDASIHVGDFNKLLLDAGFDPEVALDMEFRVAAYINDNVDLVYSNTVTATVTPYATSFPPIYMCGEAVGGWNWNLYTYKELRSSAPSIYETVAYFNNTGEYAYFRFFKQTDWGPDDWRFAFFTGEMSPLFVGQADGDNNFRFIGTSGYYHITVNMRTKSVYMESVDEPVLFMTGGALGGWDWTDNYVKLTWKANGIFQATTDFSNDIFRFFQQQGWGADYQYPWFTTVDPLLELNAPDNDNNFKFVGTPGSYIITVNLLDKIVEMDPAPAP